MSSPNLTPLYLAAIPHIAPLSGQQMQEQAGAIQQQQQAIELQRQTEAENTLKLQEMQRSQQEQSALGDLLKTKLAAASSAAAIPPTAPATTPTPADSTGQNAPDAAAADVQSDLNAPGEATPATTPSATAPPSASAPAAPKPATHLADALDSSLEEAVARGLIRPQTYLATKAKLLESQQQLILMGNEKLDQTEKLHTQIGQQLQAAKNAKDPAQKDAFYQAALRMAEGAGEKTDTYAKSLPTDPAASDNRLDSLIYANNTATAMLQQAQKKAQEDDRQAQAENRRAQAAQKEREDASADLAVAETPAEYMAARASLAKKNPLMAARFPGLSDQEITADALPEGFQQRVLETGMTPAQVIKSRQEAKKEADAKAEKDAAAEAVKFTPEIQAALVAVGAKDIKKPTAAEMSAAMDKAEQNKATSPIGTAIAWAKLAYKDAPPDVQYDRALNKFAEITKEGKVDAGNRVEQRGAIAGAAKAEQSEQTAVQDYQAYSDAINGGRTIVSETVQPNGQVRLTETPMDAYLSKLKTATGGNLSDSQAAQAKAQAIEEMKSRANRALDRAKDAVVQKKAHNQTLGTGDSVDADFANKYYDARKYGTAAAPTQQKSSVSASPVTAKPSQVPADGEIRTRGGVPYKYDASRAQWVLQQTPHSN